jgi:thymidylate synthase
MKKLILSLYLLSLLLIGCNQETKPIIYVALQNNSPENAVLSEDFLYKLARRAKRQFFVIDQLKQDQVHNIYSNPANRRSIQQIEIDPNPNTKNIEFTPSNDQALIQAFQRINDLTDRATEQPLYVYILTPGTTDITTLNQIKYLCEKIAQKPNSNNVHIHLIGLNPHNRVPTSTALSPVKANAKSAGIAYEEWNQFLRAI